ncbi:nitroreductase family deazaflavin-dependent oxidoreductase [Nocardia thailandica]|uniref:nitroreductase family deazaflavin-dependent oxidoreductase n=1 Tax=Nocardia thailandica TaxID=257275 RepID=UPI00030A108A|nr:nitroreductase family deazaflavin-dependent oxidoreductase [Nocardia thailandica]
MTVTTTETTRTGGFSRWMQHRMNARMNRKIRAGKGTFLGMDVLILHTVGRRTGQPRVTPVTWFPDGEDAWLLVASGGGAGDPDWHRNLMAGPANATIELPGTGEIPVFPTVLDGDERAEAWDRIVAAQPRYGRYQDRSGRHYPVVRLTRRA